MQRSWQRFCYLAVLMAVSSSAHAGNSFSFTVGGHHIRIEAPKNCDSASCVSISIPGIYQTSRRRERDDDDRSPPQKMVAPATPPAPAQVCAPPAAASKLPETVAAIPTPPAIAPASAPVVAPAVVRPAAPIMPQVTAPPPPPVQPVQPVAAATPTVAPPPASPTPVARPAPEVAPPISTAKISRVSHEVDDDPTDIDTPLGDWQTEGNKGSVRIERCGEALCGYVLNLASNAKGETILIDMKPKSTSGWSGNIYSRDSGNTYYATIAMKGPNSLEVQACALGHFFCSSNVWSRIDIKPMRTIAPRSILSGT